MTLLSNTSTLWNNIKETLALGGNIGPELELCCGNHPKIEMKVKEVKDFYTLSPEGGCKRICSFPMSNCDHMCPRTCHIIDTAHLTANCMEPCPKILCDLKHQCPLHCYMECTPCKVPISTKLDCGHTHNVPCYIPIQQYQCPTLIKDKQLPNCNHFADVKCSQDLNNFICLKKCDISLPCSHDCTKQCHVTIDPNHKLYSCKKHCDRNPPQLWQ